MPTPTTRNEVRHFKHDLLQIILLPVGLVFIAAVFLTVFLFNMFEVISQTNRSNQVLYQTRTCEKLVVDLETGLRGFGLSNQREFLEPYERSMSHLDQEFQMLLELVADNPVQANLVKSVIREKNDWLASVPPSFLQRSPQNPVLPVTAADVIKMRSRKVFMDQIRSQFATILNTEEGLNRERFQKVKQTKRQLVWIGSSLALFLMVTITVHAWRQFALLALTHRQALIEAESNRQELQNQTEWLQVTLASVGDGVISVDREGRVLFMNAKAEELTGWTMDQAINKSLEHVFCLVSDPGLEPLSIPLDRVMQERRGTELGHSTVLRGREGKVFPVEVNVAPIEDPLDASLGVILAFRDVTDTRRAQQALVTYSERLEKEVSLRTQALQATILELETFSYTVSHDLRSPLRAMQGYAVAVLEDYGDRLDEVGRNYLARIQKASHRMDQLVEDVLAFTRANRSDTPLISVNVDKLIRDLIEQYPNLQSPAVDIAVEDRLPTVMGRVSSLTQVFSNLLGNAVKFVAPGVQPRVRVWGEEKDGVVKIWVEDNGIGVASENHERVFNIFEQINDSTLYSGTGIGLAIVRRAVESVQGKVGVESNLGHGSRFWVELKKGRTDG